jgi:hypothetical protein
MEGQMSAVQDLNELNFQVYERGGAYVLVSQQFGIIVRADNLDTGAAEMRQRLSMLLKEFDALGIPAASAAAFSGTVAAAADNPQSLKQAAIISAVKAGIAAAIFGLLLLALLFPFVQIGSGIRNSLYTAFPFGMNVEAVGRSAINWVGKVANTVEGLTPEREKELEDAVRKIAAKVLPLVEAARNPDPARTAPAKP